jgi:macrolide-specific efflux system membrane fusion protein
MKTRIFTGFSKLPIFIKLSFVITLALGTFFAFRFTHSSSSSDVMYQTETVNSGTLITSISTSGTISSSNTTNVDTRASGVVQEVYVANGDYVKEGQTILTLTLDNEGIERRSSAWSTYLAAKDAVATAEKNKQDTEIEVWQKKQAILDAEDAYDYMLNHGSEYTDAEKNELELAVDQARLAFDVTASEFTHVTDDISAAKVTASAAYRDYQDVSGTIVAPASGIINNLTLTQGSSLVASSSQSTSSGATYASSQTIGFIRAGNNEYLAEVSLTESDVVKVAAGQKVTLEMDAHPDVSFTGHVLAVDVSGSSNSGVSSYPATIVMDATNLPIYPNMSVTATIITGTHTDVLLIPLSAVTTKDDTSYVKKVVDGEQVSVEVKLGADNDTNVIITSGLAEGDEIVTSSASSVKNNNDSSAFSSSNNRMGGIPMGGPGF